MPRFSAASARTPLQSAMQPTPPPAPNRILSWDTPLPPTPPTTLHRPLSPADPARTPSTARSRRGRTTLESLAARAQSGDIVFRVHSSSSPSGLVWTGNPATSGFFAWNRRLHISPAAYVSAWDHVDLGPDGAYVCQTMVDHITGKLKQSLVFIESTIQDRPGTPEDDKSPWISTCAEGVWVVWEVARRLASGEERVEVAVIDRRGSGAVAGAGAGDGDGDGEGYAGRELRVVPARHISLGLSQGTHGPRKLAVSAQEQFDLALRLSRESSEVMYFARIFAESVQVNHEFSVEELPIKLPEQFYKPRSQGSPRDRDTGLDADGLGLEGWLAKLVWDPRTDGYARAVDKIVERRRKVMMSRGVERVNCPMRPL